MLVTLVAVIGGAFISAPASSSPIALDQRASRAVKALIGPSMIRAEVVTLGGGSVGDYRVYRGVVVKVRGRLVTLTQRDGTLVHVRLARTTEIRVDARRSALQRLRLGMHATVMRNGSAAATWLYASRRSSDYSQARIRSLLSTGFVRCEVISWTGGAVLDNRAYTGVIETADSGSLSLLGADGTPAQIRIDASTQVWVNNRVAAAANLTTGMRTTTIGTGDGLAGQIWAYGKSAGFGKR